MGYCYCLFRMWSQRWRCFEIGCLQYLQRLIALVLPPNNSYEANSESYIETFSRCPYCLELLRFGHLNSVLTLVCDVGLLVLSCQQDYSSICFKPISFQDLILLQNCSHFQQLLRHNSSTKPNCYAKICLDLCLVQASLRYPLHSKMLPSRVVQSN